MSTFAVTLRKIDRVWNHPNADKLSMAAVEGLGYQFVTDKDQFKVGDPVLYFPIDSQFSPEVLAKLDPRLVVKLAFGNRPEGVNDDYPRPQNRLKTVVLRDEPSQGLALPPHIVLGDDYAIKYPSVTDFTQVLGVTKYEHPVEACQNGLLVELPAHVPVYDIENVQARPDILAMLMDIKVVITEKAEGINFGVTSTKADEQFVLQRHNAIQELPGDQHQFWRIARELDFLSKAKKVCHEAANIFCNGEDSLIEFDVESLTLRGEYLGPGVQKNRYGIQKNTVLLFDILCSRHTGHIRYIDAVDFLKLCEIFSMKTVPVISVGKTLREWLAGRDILKASYGDSLLGGFIREGIVIRPEHEQNVPGFGRLILKVRDPVYLAKTGA